MTDTDSPTTDSLKTEVQKASPVPRFFSRTIFVVFIWVMFGVCGIYGVRLWFNSVPHPVFTPIIAASFCATLAFTIVLFLETVSGPIVLKIRPGTEFTGASGPIIMWCLCFMVIALGLYMMGIVETIKLPAQQHDDRPIHRLTTKLP